MRVVMLVVRVRLVRLGSDVSGEGEVGEVGE